MIPLLATLVLLAPPQTATPPPLPSEEELLADGWRFVDGIAAQVGDEVITWSTLESSARATNPETPAVEALRNLVIPSLMVQAGEDIGLSRERVDQIVSQAEADQRARRGSRAYAESLAESGVDALELKTAQTREQNRVVWVLIQRGQLGPGGDPKRPIRDPYVRPGILRSLYRFRQTDLRNELGEPDQVMFQALIVSAADNGGLAPAEARAEELVDRARGGEDYSTLVRLNSAVRDNQGLSSWYDPTLLRDEAIRTFALTAAVGDVSDPFPLSDPETGEVVGYRILRLHDRQEGRPPPPFSHREAQHWLRNEFARNWRKAIFDREIGKLQAQTHIWVDPRLRPPPAESEPADGGS